METAPPSVPGMPWANSIPARPRAAANVARRESVAPLSARSAVSPAGSMRENSSPMRSTMRCSGASVTRRFVPLPMRNGFSPAPASRVQTASISAIEDGSSIASQGPPMRNEQWRLIGSFSRIVSSGQRECASRRKERSSASLILRPPSGRGAQQAPARRCSPFCARGCSSRQARGSRQDFAPDARG